MNPSLCFHPGGGGRQPKSQQRGEGSLGAIAGKSVNFGHLSSKNNSC